MKLETHVTQEMYEQAAKEVSEERRREEIEKLKIKLRTKKTIWEKLFPFKIVRR